MSKEPEDILVAMRKDLERALDRPDAARRWVFIIDLRKCVGCRACTAACLAENATPRGLAYHPVFEEESGTFPDVSRRFIPRPCQHCDHPPCVGVCPKKGKATWKSTEGISGGMVLIDYDECIQCGKCVKACPYQARGKDQGLSWSDRAPFIPEYEKRASDEYGKKWRNDGKSVKFDTPRKCQMCFHRIREGILPACTATCIGRAHYFGDENDPQSVVAKVKKANIGRSLVWIGKVSEYSALTGKVTFGGTMTNPRVAYILPEKRK